MTRKQKPQQIGWRIHLPNFETVASVDLGRHRAANALKRLEWPRVEEAVRDCKPSHPCRSGLCPCCVRDLRVRLLDFLEYERLHELVWYFVTIRVEGWTVAPGDFDAFGKLRDHRHVEALLTRFRRLNKPGLMLFGSIETVYRTVANIPVGKPFHLHLMISGLAEAEIERAVTRTIPLSTTDIVPLDISRVGGTRGDFFAAASYAFKQPFWKRSASESGIKGHLQAPSAAQLRELICNLGVHGWAGRLILLGIRCDSGRFRLMSNLSATAPNANLTMPRQSAARGRGQGP